MGDTFQDADPDEAAFQRLEQGLAALRRDAARLRQPLPGAPGGQSDPREFDASLAEVNRRIDAVASRIAAAGNPAPADTGPILTALAAVEEKISKLTAGLDRFAEQSVLNEATAAANARIDNLAARLDARLNQLQEAQAEFKAQLQQAEKPPKPASVPAPPIAPPPRAPVSAFARMSKAAPEPARSHLPALLVLVVMVLAAAASLAWLRPDLVKSDQVLHEWLQPARDKAMHWLQLSRKTSATPPAAMAAAVAPPAPAPDNAAGPSPSAAAEARSRDDETPVSGLAVPQDAGQPPMPEPAIAAEAAPSVPEPSSPPVPPETAVAADPDAMVPAPAAVQPSPHIVLGAKADTWLMVQSSDGRSLLARILHEGETWPVPDEPGLRLSTGNAGATLVWIDGAALPALGNSGGVRHDIPLDATALAIDAPPSRKLKHHANDRPVGKDRKTEPPQQTAKLSASASR